MSRDLVRQAELAAWTSGRERALRRTTVVLGSLLAVLLGEALLRAAAALSPEGAADLSRTRQLLAPPATADCRRQRAQATVGALVRPSTVPDVIYELKPGLDTCFQGVRVRTGADGLRSDGGLRAPGPPGLFRILLLGDSQAFGWGLEEAETLGARLAAELGGPAADRVEVVNAGVPGYNTGQEAAYLRARGLRHRPDCVMVLFIPNDLGLPPFLLRPRSALLASRSLLLSRLARFFALGMRPDSPDASWETPAVEDQSLPLDGERAQVPSEYQHLVGVAGYRRALRSLAETSRAHGVPVVNVADYDTPGVDWGALEREQEALGVVHVAPRLSWSSRGLWLGDHDPHLAPRAVSELARRLAAEMRRRGVCLPPS